MECSAKIVKGCNYFRDISFFSIFVNSSTLWNQSITDFLNTGLIFTPEVFILCKKGMEAVRDAGLGFWYTFYYNSFSLKLKNGTSIRKSRYRHKKFYRIYLNFCKPLQCFLETSEVESFLNALAGLPGSYPQNCFEQVFCKANLRASPSVKKDLHSWRYLRNFSEFQKCTKLESAVFGMQFTKKELNYRHGLDI